MLTLGRVRRNSSRTAGFTLLEIMIVLAIVSIIAVVGTPKYQAVKNQYRLEASAQAVVAELKYAKQYTMDNRQVVSVILTESEVRVMEMKNGDIIDSKRFDVGVKFDSSQNSWLDEGLTFDNRGFNNLSGTITLMNSSGRTVGVKIEEKTGYLAIIWP